ncbi:hypothetical protein BaRGS_00009533 [Batillaria attramentaria]|uniref:Major facilitator superfamily (MFS) profile domain-containing protein n=1 Tax=Batillaria attramentaria TaxID=370345 RepID=A0ABD0LJE2_9CAEN
MAPDQQHNGKEPVTPGHVHNDHEKPESGELRRLYNPVDTGWSWVILMSVFMVQFFFVGLLRSFGVLFVAIQHSFHASSSMVSLIGSLEAVFFSIFAPVTMSVILNVLSVRQSVVIGGIIGACGIAVCALATSVEYVVGMFSITVGISLGMAGGPGFVLLNIYFNRKLPLATAIANTGGSIGSVVMPIATRMLLDEFLLSGAFLLLGGMYAQTVIFGFLYTPPSHYGPKRVKRQDYHPEGTKGTEMTELQEALLIRTSAASNHRRRTVSESAADIARDQIDSSESLAQSQGHLNAQNEISRERRVDRTLASDQKASELVVVSSLHGSHGVSLDNLNSDDITTSSRGESVTKVEKHVHNQLQKDSDCSPSCCSKKRSNVSCSFHVCDVKDPVSWCLHVYHCLGSIAAGVSSAFIPLLAEEKHLTTTEGALLMTIAGVLDIISRLVPGFLAQSGLMKPQTMVAICLAIIGVLFQLTSVTNNMAAMIAVVVVFGLFSGVFFTMIPLILVDVMGMEKFRPALGATQFFMGMAGVLGFPILGLMKDASGSYVMAFHFIGACALLAMVLLLLIPRIQQWFQKRKTPVKTLIVGVP